MISLWGHGTRQSVLSLSFRSSREGWNTSKASSYQPSDVKYVCLGNFLLTASGNQFKFLCMWFSNDIFSMQWAKRLERITLFSSLTSWSAHSLGHVACHLGHPSVGAVWKPVLLWARTCPLLCPWKQMLLYEMMLSVYNSNTTGWWLRMWDSKPVW